jgi:hypothetical protein
MPDQELLDDVKDKDSIPLLKHGGSAVKPETPSSLRRSTKSRGWHTIPNRGMQPAIHQTNPTT